MAGIIAGNGALSRRAGTASLRGVAPQANLAGVKVPDAEGRGTVGRVLQGINWCLINRQALRIRVLNLSLSGAVMESFRTDPLCQAAERAIEAGLLVVAAAGNRGRALPSDPNSPSVYGTIGSPGNDPYALTVGATKTMGTMGIADDAVTSYSSRGPTLFDLIVKPDLVAPGNRVVSLDAQANGYGYTEKSGTSMAAPVVSGAAALLLAREPTLTPATVKVRLMKTARRRWNPSQPIPDRFAAGAGYLDLPAALCSTLKGDSTGQTPSLAGLW